MQIKVVASAQKLGEKKKTQMMSPLNFAYESLGLCRAVLRLIL